MLLDKTCSGVLGLVCLTHCDKCGVVVERGHTMNLTGTTLKHGVRQEGEGRSEMDTPLVRQGKTVKHKTVIVAGQHCCFNNNCLLHKLSPRTTPPFDNTTVLGTHTHHCSGSTQHTSAPPVGQHNTYIRKSKSPQNYHGDNGRPLTLEPHLLPQLLRILQVELMQRLNVVRGEGNGHQEQVGVSPLHQTTYHLVRLRTQPG